MLTVLTNDSSVRSNLLEFCDDVVILDGAEPLINCVSAPCWLRVLKIKSYFFENI